MTAVWVYVRFLETNLAILSPYIFPFEGFFFHSFRSSKELLTGRCKRFGYIDFLVTVDVECTHWGLKFVYKLYCFPLPIELVAYIPSRKIGNDLFSFRFVVSWKGLGCRNILIIKLKTHFICQRYNNVLTASGLHVACPDRSQKF